MRNFMETYDSYLSYYFRLNGEKTDLFNDLENEIVMIADLGVPIMQLKHIPSVRKIQKADKYFVVTCSLPDYVNLAAFELSEYSKIAPYIFELFDHDPLATDVLMADEDLKIKLVESFVVDQRYYQSDFDKLYSLISELDDKINPADESFTISQL